MKTVNVIEYSDATILSLRAFPDTKAGNKQAEELFQKLAKENNIPQNEIDCGLENGYCDDCCHYELYLVHSK